MKWKLWMTLPINVFKNLPPNLKDIGKDMILTEMLPSALSWI